ncbi:hypothetical protein NLJ89_g8551 [Agrocybe chaxingu]|uniref:KOW domain-containing protein n=1 Tax=Agrocybe chaxingu TaxID=84603 RepID=A0A9W8JUF9_9AGAR|nr:hypothetical protein NLJ89_g8551 [Agrocybe chaxingu]
MSIQRGELRSSKRRRVDTNIFLDLEAATEGGEEESEDDSELEEDEELYGEEEMGRNIAKHRQLQRAVDETKGSYWEDLVKRAKSRARMPDSYNGTFVEGPTTSDCLWEIGCRLGYEEASVFAVMNLTCETGSLEDLAIAVIGRCSIPGRVFAEVKERAQAERLARAIPHLKSVLRPVPPAEMTAILTAKSPYTLTPGTWVSVRDTRSKWRTYRTDTGLIVQCPRSRKLHVLLIPRIQTTSSPSTNSRPEAQPAPTDWIASTFGGSALKSEGPNLYRFRTLTLLSEGFLLIDVDDIDVVTSLDTLPSMEELLTFARSAYLDTQLIELTKSRMALSHCTVGDRVKVIRGDFSGLVGQIRDLSGSEVTVYLETQDCICEVLTRDVRVAFRVGDEVRILSGTHTGQCGWVVKVFPDTANLLCGITVGLHQLQLYSSPIHTRLRRRHRLPWLPNQKDPNAIYIGKRIQVVGKSVYKGYKGSIKNTNAKGTAWVELDARMGQGLVSCCLRDLAILDSDKFSALLIPVAEESPPAPEPMAQSTSIVDSGTCTTPMPPRNLEENLSPAWDPLNSGTCATPMPPRNLDENLSPAWDPLNSSRTPNVSLAASSLNVPHLVSSFGSPNHASAMTWLWDVSLSSMRIRLLLEGHGNRSLEFLEIITADTVRVRHGMSTETVSISSLTAVHPRMKDDLVTFIRGENIGQLFKIKEYKGDTCLVRKVGYKPKRREKDSEVDLVADHLYSKPVPPCGHMIVTLPQLTRLSRAVAFVSLLPTTPVPSHYTMAKTSTVKVQTLVQKYKRQNDEIARKDDRIKHLEGLLAKKKKTTPIPKPKGQAGRQYNLWKAMGISKKRYNRLLKLVKHQASPLLDTRLTIRQQDTCRLKLACTRAIKAYPVFREYQNGWPVRDFLKQWLANSKKKFISLELKEQKAVEKGKDEPDRRAIREYMDTLLELDGEEDEGEEAKEDEEYEEDEEELEDLNLDLDTINIDTDVDFESAFLDISLLDQEDKDLDAEDSGVEYLGEEDSDEEDSDKKDSDEEDSDKKDSDEEDSDEENSDEEGMGREDLDDDDDDKRNKKNKKTTTQLAKKPSMVRPKDAEVEPTGEKERRPVSWQYVSAAKTKAMVEAEEEVQASQTKTTRKTKTVTKPVDAKKATTTVAAKATSKAAQLTNEAAMKTAVQTKAKTAAETKTKTVAETETATAKKLAAAEKAAARKAAAAEKAAARKAAAAEKAAARKAAAAEKAVTDATMPPKGKENVNPTGKETSDKRKRTKTAKAAAAAVQSESEEDPLPARPTKKQRTGTKNRKAGSTSKVEGSLKLTATKASCFIMGPECSLRIPKNAQAQTEHLQELLKAYASEVRPTTAVFIHQELQAIEKNKDMLADARAAGWAMKVDYQSLVTRVHGLEGKASQLFDDYQVLRTSPGFVWVTTQLQEANLSLKDFLKMSNAGKVRMASDVSHAGYYGPGGYEVILTTLRVIYGDKITAQEEKIAKTLAKWDWKNGSSDDDIDKNISKGIYQLDLLSFLTLFVLPFIVASLISEDLLIDDINDAEVIRWDSRLFGNRFHDEDDETSAIAQENMATLNKLENGSILVQGVEKPLALRRKATRKKLDVDNE